jgi:hypothetical protein
MIHLWVDDTGSPAGYDSFITNLEILMKISKPLIWLCLLIALFVLVYAGLGLFWQDGGSPTPFTTLRGQTVEISGKGIYRYDTSFFYGGFRGNDAISLFVELPLLITAILLYRRGSLRGGCLLAGSLAYVLYNSFSLGTSAAYNPLFLLYTATFCASLFAIGMLWAQVDFESLSKRVLPKFPARGAAYLLFFVGIATALLWLSDIVPPLMQGATPGFLGPYTTAITYFMDLGIITPLCLLAGYWLLRHDARGYLVGFMLLYLLALMGVIVVAQTIFQVNAGVVFTTSQYIGMIGSWVVMGSIAIGFVSNFLWNLSDTRLPSGTTE